MLTQDFTSTTVPQYLRGEDHCDVELAVAGKAVGTPLIPCCPKVGQARFNALGRSLRVVFLHVAEWQ